jgi:hypothetical protein
MRQAPNTTLDVPYPSIVGRAHAFRFDTAHSVEKRRAKNRMESAMFLATMARAKTGLKRCGALVFGVG